MADKYIVSLIMIIFLGSTLLFYYLKPHETSMFIRLHKETVGQEEKSMDIIYQLIRSEYIRRVKAYPLEILDRELIRATKLPKNKVYSLVENLAKIDMDILLTERKDDNGTIVKMIDFTSVTESYDKKGIAQKKAKKILSERLYKKTIKYCVKGWKGVPDETGEDAECKIVNGEMEDKLFESLIRELSLTNLSHIYSAIINETEFTETDKKKL